MSKMSELASQLEDIHVGKRISCRTWDDLKDKVLYLSSIGYGVAVNGFKDTSDNVLTITALPEKNDPIESESMYESNQNKEENMTSEERINRLRNIQRNTPIHTRDDIRDFETLEAAIEDIETLDWIESTFGKELEELKEESIAKNRLMAVSGMSIEELTDAFTKGYRLVDKANNQVPNMKVTKVTIDEARIVFQLDKETEGKQSEEQNGIFIPENATNGDVIKEVFPNAEIKHGFYGIDIKPLVCLCLNTNTEMYEASFAEEWWNAPYQKGDSDEN